MTASKGRLRGRKLLEVLLLFTGHNGLLRIGELLCGLQVSDVIWDSDLLGFQIFLERTKTGRSGPGVYVAFRDHGSISAVSLMRDWFDDNDLWSCHTSHIFPSSRGGEFDFSKTMSQDHFRKVIAAWTHSIGLDSTKYSGHSLRAGGATDLFTMRVPYYIIKKMGRWVSDAALCYYRDDEDVIVSVTEAFGGCY
jgi:integrase